jgi:hypothetical protein
MMAVQALGYYAASFDQKISSVSSTPVASTSVHAKGACVAMSTRTDVCGKVLGIQ